MFILGTALLFVKPTAFSEYQEVIQKKERRKTVREKDCHYFRY